MKYTLLLALLFSLSVYSNNSCISYEEAQDELSELISSQSFYLNFEAESFNVTELMNSLNYNSGKFYAQADFQVEVDCWPAEQCADHPDKGVLLVSIDCDGNAQYKFSYYHD